MNICRKITFEASHRLYPCVTKCKNWHGHSYKVFVYARRIYDELNNDGMVVDFSELKNGIGKWIDEHWDHALLFNQDDKDTEKVLEQFPSKCYGVPFNPTAENMCYYLLHIICPSIYADCDFEIFKVRVYETEDCYAEESL